MKIRTQNIYRRIMWLKMQKNNLMFQKIKREKERDRKRNREKRQKKMNEKNTEFYLRVC